MALLRHKPTGDLYPMNPDLRRHPDMEVVEEIGVARQDPEPLPSDPSVAKPKRSARRKKAPEPVVEDDSTPLELDEYKP